MKFVVRGSLKFRASLDKKFFFTSSIIKARNDYWVFEVDDGQASEARP